MITPEQCRAARGLLDWSQLELASRSGVGASTIRSFEAGRHRLIRANARQVQEALEAAGVLFLGGEGEEGPGVRIRRGPAAVPPKGAVPGRK